MVVSGYFLLAWRNSYNSSPIGHYYSALRNGIQSILESTRSRDNFNKGSTDIRTARARKRFAEDRGGLAGTITCQPGYLSYLDSNYAGQHDDNSGELKSSTGDGRHSEFRFTVSGDDPAEITREVETSLETALDKARKLRIEVERIRATRLRWLLHERNRLRQ